MSRDIPESPVPIQFSKNNSLETFNESFQPRRGWKLKEKSFQKILYEELIYCKRFKTKQQAYDEIYRYIEFFYNRKRIHGSIGYLSPVRFAALFNKRKVA